MKTVSSREFFHHPTTVRALKPGQSLAVTDNGKRSFTVTKAGKRPRLTLADIEKRAVHIKGKGKLNLVAAIRDVR
jgi:hypothetical protein